MHGRAALLRCAILGAVGLWGCGEDECRAVAVTSDQECTTTQDCVDQEFTGFSCINGTCQRACFFDEDCARPSGDATGCPVDEGFQAAICENQVCTVGCPQRDCPAGQNVCAEGRCAYYFEGFEAASGGAVPSFESLGFRQLDRELRNNRNEIRFAGSEGCELGPSCAGPAASGERFALIGTLPAPEKGTPETDRTCRACACCLECRLDPPPQSLGLLVCPQELSVPPRLFCGPARLSCEEMPDTEMPAACTALCEACEACTDHPEDRVGALLHSCEATAASKACPPCLACEPNEEACETCRQQDCAEACQNVSSEACAQCEADENCPCADCRACEVCPAAENCLASGGATSECRRLEQECDALGADGCFPVPVNYPRLELTDGEQALESPAIDLSSASGDVVLEFSYVPFNVGFSYTRSEQGVSACDWEQGVPQEVVVQYCAGSCQDDSSWEDVEGGSLPPQDQRNNSLRLREQSGVDWRSGRVSLPVPERFRTSGFRFRFLPRMSESARFGLDDLRVRAR